MTALYLEYNVQRKSKRHWGYASVALFERLYHLQYIAAARE